jgi:hypothetical protein
VTISERIAAARRERRVLARVSRAAWRLDQAERERTWALVSARAEGISIRTLATAIGLSPSGCTRSWPMPTWTTRSRRSVSCEQQAGRPPKTPTAMRTLTWTAAAHLADRLSDEVDWLRRCAGWLRQLDGGGHPPAVNLRPSADWPAVVGGLADSAGYRWGGWGSNPRPADYEKYGLVHRAR